MLEIIHSIKKLDIAQLMYVYTQSNSESGDILQTEQDFYWDLLDFFAQSGTFYAVWHADDMYASAVRVEAYRDGYIIAGLETAPTARNKGYAKKLITAVIDHLPKSCKLYSHVDKKNIPSIAVHTACGFERILEHAVYLDGSVLPSSCTFCRTV